MLFLSLVPMMPQGIHSIADASPWSHLKNCLETSSQPAAVTTVSLSNRKIHMVPGLSSGEDGKKWILSLALITIDGCTEHGY